MSTSFHRYR